MVVLLPFPAAAAAPVPVLAASRAPRSVGGSSCCRGAGALGAAEAAAAAGTWALPSASASSGMGGVVRWEGFPSDLDGL